MTIEQLIKKYEGDTFVGAEATHLEHILDDPEATDEEVNDSIDRLFGFLKEKWLEEHRNA